MQLALLRHGHTDWNRAGRIQGRSDIPLDAQARAELGARALPEAWQDADLWSSPLSRAADTATLVTGRTPRTSPALTEMNWGAWEGHHGADLRATSDSGFKDIEDWGWDFCPPDGESPRDVAARLAPWLGRLQRDTFAVCHIGVMRVLLAQAWGWDFQGPCPFTIKRNRFYILTRTETGWHPEPDPIRLRERSE